MVQLTERAAREVAQIIAQHAPPGPDGTRKKMYLRVGIKGGGCSGFTYSLDLTEVKGEDDESWVANDIEVICDPKSQIYLDGTTIDFKDELMGRGFVFSNPNASSSCGCGSSFAV
ncbi:MAG TPA: iron-sulfur cluster assembly accessory protein [Phycisphaerae bacterium]|nr:iron-sulfur cluster assembly accessory protein [Phycisphaerae bacterium]HNU45601.1 iron-sulfur cluster assembly accessory protein [Phycisphaerae bacterium]